VSRVLADLGFDYKDERQAKTLGRGDAETVLKWLRAVHKLVPPEKLGRLSEEAYGYQGYGNKLGTWPTPSGSIIPYVIEAWASAKPPEKKGVSQATGILLFVNRTRALARLYGSANVGGIELFGCGMDRWVELKSAQYTILLSIVTPYVQLSTDGKEPVLSPLGNAIEAALKRACNAARRAMEKPPGEMSIKEAAYEVMEEAYLAASGGGGLHANARQIMYAARGKILELTGRETLDDNYFTETLLPNYRTILRRRRIGKWHTMPGVTLSSRIPIGRSGWEQSRCEAIWDRKSRSGQRSVCPAARCIRRMGR
jgi:hypothetical protein